MTSSKLTIKINSCRSRTENKLIVNTQSHPLQNERVCECSVGYVGNGVQCLEKVVRPVDRCLEDNGDCDPVANCKDLHYHGNTSTMTYS